LAFDAESRLWAAGGPVTDDATAGFLACTRIAEQQEQPALVSAPLPEWLPGEAAHQLEAKVGNEAAVLAEAAKQRRLASQLLKKWRYPEREREHRKRQRRDKVAAQQQGQQAQLAAEEVDGQQ
jgi:hypothetical protein